MRKIQCDRIYKTKFTRLIRIPGQLIIYQLSLVDDVDVHLFVGFGSRQHFNMPLATTVRSMTIYYTIKIATCFLAVDLIL